ncbi:MAG: hypothetical protein JSR46_07180, partial [Verrucomicrobia bacterium]|nr:hypothetical protein [Verrucomicrobiota bacterium]
MSFLSAIGQLKPKFHSKEGHTDLESQISVIDHAIDLLSQEPAPNLVRLYERVQAIEETMKLAAKDGLWNVEELFSSKLAPYREQLRETEKARFRQSEWLRLGFPEGLLTSVPDCVDFLVESRFAYLCEAFKNSPLLREGERPILDMSDVKIEIKMNGKYQSWYKVRDTLYFDVRQEAVVSKDNKNIFYNCIYPDGIVEKSPRPGEFYPIGQLKSSDYSALMEHAKKFWNVHPEIDPGEEKESILQLGTSQAACLSEHWLID